MIVYGGELDALNGKLKVTHDLQTFSGNESWTLSGTTYFYCSKPKDNIKASQTLIASNGIVLRYSTNGQIRVYISENTGNVDTSTNMNTLMTSGINFRYELATPTEISVDSVNWQSKYGDNNLYCDTGDTECEYRADIALALGQ